MKKVIAISLLSVIAFASLASVAEAKSTIGSYKRSSGTTVRSYTRYKADGYKFNNYQYRPDRGYHR